MSHTLDRPQDIARNIVSPRAYAELNSLLASFAWLRANDPVSLIETENFDPFWAVTKHADIMQIGRDKAAVSLAACVKPPSPTKPAYKRVARTSPAAPTSSAPSSTWMTRTT